MHKLSLIAISLSILVLSSCSQKTDDHTLAGMPSSHGSSVAIDRLNASPRHQEWVEIKSNGKTIYTWVVYPEVKGPRPVVILIHENRGLNDWARSMADQVAEAGYIAVAPDLLSGFSETKQRTSDFASEDDARSAIGELKQEQVLSDLQSVVSWAKKIPSSNAKIATAGFCWGGAQSFQFATKSSDIALSMVFYGTGPTDKSVYANIASPVVGFYGGKDERVNATIADSKEAMSSAGKMYEYEIYEGAGHAFMRLGEEPTGESANIIAREKAWHRMLEKLATLQE